MLLSTAMPIAMAAIVIVIISRGSFIRPIRPKTKLAANKFGIIPINDKDMDLNNIKNIINIKITTKPNDFICESNKEVSMLLYNTNKPLLLKQPYQIYLKYLKIDQKNFLSFKILVFSSKRFKDQY